MIKKFSIMFKKIYYLLKKHFLKKEGKYLEILL